MRTEIERRPLLLFCLATIVGIAAVNQPIAALFLVPLFFLSGLQPRLLAAAGFTLGVLISPGPPAPQILEQEYFKGLATVSSVPEHYSNGMRSKIRIGERELFLYHGDIGIGLGDELQVQGILKPLSEASAMVNPRIAGVLQPQGTIEVTRRGNSFARLGMLWRDAFLRFSVQTLDAQAHTIVAALCFNVDDTLDQGLRTDLQRTGTTHIVSTSGLHVVIFAFGLHGILSLFPVPRPLQMAVLAVILLLYAFATGMHPPVMRAVVMALVYFGAFLARREPDGLSALAFSALAYLLWKPASLFEIGFQLSFVAVAAMALFLQTPEEAPPNLLRRLLLAIKQLMLVSLVASIGTAPLIAYYFGTISIISILANLLIGVVLPPLILVALVSFALNPILPSVAVGAMKIVVEPLAGWILAVAHTLGSLPFASMDVPPFNAYWLVLAYALLLLVWRKRPRPVQPTSSDGVAVATQQGQHR